MSFQNNCFIVMVCLIMLDGLTSRSNVVYLRTRFFLRLCAGVSCGLLSSFVRTKSTDNILCLVYHTRQCIAPPTHRATGSAFLVAQRNTPYIYFFFITNRLYDFTKRLTSIIALKTNISIFDSYIYIKL